jgi:hypothetical protein
VHRLVRELGGSPRWSRRVPVRARRLLRGLLPRARSPQVRGVHMPVAEQRAKARGLLGR